MRECGNVGIPELRMTYYVLRFLIRSLIGECGNAGIPEQGTTYYVPRFLIRSLIRECGNAVLRNKVHQVFNLIDN